MKKQTIRDVKLGHRQLSFGFEDRAFKEQDLVISRITDEFQKSGYAVLDEFIQQTSEVIDLSESEILQHIFWSAQDLKIHFRIQGKKLDPNRTRKILLESPEQRVIISPVKAVDESLFQAVKQFYQQLTGKSDNDGNDQYEFSWILEKKIKDWELLLASCRSGSQKPYFPGKKEIDSCFQVIEKISTKRDAFSLITAFHRYKDQILRLDRDIKKLSGFYTRHSEFWETLIHSVDAFRDNAVELQKDPETASAFERLKRIVSSSKPYDSIEKASELLQKVSARHDRIVADQTEKHRVFGLAEVDHMIERMRRHLNRRLAGQDFRNRALYTLRLINKKIHHAETIQTIDRLLEEAQEQFEILWEEVEWKII